MISIKKLTAEEMIERGIEKYRYMNVKAITGLFLSFILLLVPFSVGTKVIADEIAERINCSYFAQFSNGYELAQLALPFNHRLDGYPKDGIACNSELKPSKVINSVATTSVIQ